MFDKKTFKPLKRWRFIDMTLPTILMRDLSRDTACLFNFSNQISIPIQSAIYTTQGILDKEKSNIHLFILRI